MVGKKLFGILLAMIAMLAVPTVSALPVDILEVELDEDTLDPYGENSIRAIDRNNEFEVKVRVKALEDVDDAQIEVVLRGYDNDDRVEDIYDVFDMRENRTYVKEFTLDFPYRLDKDEYRLRVRIDDRNGDTTQIDYEIAIEADRHAMMIKDVIFSPSNSVVAGRSLLTTVRLENIGMVDDDEGIRVSVTIPELGISAADYIDELDDDDSVSSEELYLRIPACTTPGVYQAIIEVVYDDGDEVESLTRFVTVTEGDLCPGQEEPEQPKTIITVGPTTQDVTPGEGGVIYPLTISNAGNDARTYVVTADGYQSFADVSISPQNIVVLQPGEAKAMFVQLSAKEDAAAGEKMFTLTVTSGSETLKQFVLKANVQESQEPAVDASRWASVKRVLEIGLVVLVVLLVILGLIIGFSRLRGNDEEFDDEEGKSETYY
jgi:hypothetical protein